MFLIRANIQFSNQFRKENIIADIYRPLLFFSKTVIRTSSIDFEGRQYFEMDKSYERVLLKIYFYSDLDCKKEFYIGREFAIGEGTDKIGLGVIVEIIGDDKEQSN